MRNAERTIAATLDSICRQTHHKLDIIVVDDGSTDGSVAIVDDRIGRDRRVRLIRQVNAGVAAARNAGAAGTSAAFLAFVDADDLWAPTKIEYQLKAIQRGGAEVGLAYSWFASIDQGDRVVSFGPQPLHEGDTMAALCESNWIGNGSSLLLRRAAFEKAGGFDLTLRARGAEGAEDLLICFRVAEHFTFAVVPRYLVGYRARPDSMSTDAMQLFRSTVLVLDEYRAKFPEHAAKLAHHLQAAYRWYAYRAGASGRYADAFALVTGALGHRPVPAAWHFAGVAFSIARSRLQRRLGRPVALPLYTEAIW